MVILIINQIMSYQQKMLGQMQQLHHLQENCPLNLEGASYNRRWLKDLKNFKKARRALESASEKISTPSAVRPKKNANITENALVGCGINVTIMEGMLYDADFVKNLGQVSTAPHPLRLDIYVCQYMQCENLYISWLCRLPEHVTKLIFF